MSATTYRVHSPKKSSCRTENGASAQNHFGFRVSAPFSPSLTAIFRLKGLIAKNLRSGFKFFKHGSRIAKELNLNPQDIEIGHSLALPCVTGIGEVRAACRHFREIWREFNLEHSHGSVDPFLYASLIPIRFTRHERPSSILFSTRQGAL